MSIFSFDKLLRIVEVICNILLNAIKSLRPEDDEEDDATD